MSAKENTLQLIEALRDLPIKVEVRYNTPSLYLSYESIDEILKLAYDLLASEAPKAITADNRAYDGNDIESARDFYHLAFNNWGEVIRYEDGFNAAVAEQGERLKLLLVGEK